MPFPEVGITAPDFEARTDADQLIRLADLRGQTVILYFYPKADTPGCTQQACNFRDNYGVFAERGVLVIGVSPDTVEAQKAFKTKFDLPFTLIADADHAVSELYGIWGDHEVKTRSDKLFRFTGAYRSTLVIDQTGVVRSARWGVDPANDTQEVLALLDQLTAQ
ncbi:MAG: peroxiredoxin [Anaerolineae bacterium]